MQPTVSIVMPCYNGRSHLRQGVASVVAQDRGDWELIVVDDGSTDGSEAIIGEMAHGDSRIRALHQRNGGAVAARNVGLSAARGVYVAFLDCDDTWEPAFLSEMVRALERDPAAGIAYCGWQNIGLGAGRDRPYVPPDIETPDKVETILRGCPWPIHGALVKRALLNSAGGFDPAMGSWSEDYELWLRIATRERLVRVPRVLAYYHFHGIEQSTRNGLRMALNYLRAQEKFLASNPAVRRRLGVRRVRNLTLGELLKRGYAAYWNRDLPTARAIFRHVMAHGYGSFKDWLYMLPALLPASLHRGMLRKRDIARRGAAPTPHN